MWDEGLVWKGGLSGRTVWIKRLGKDLQDDDVMMMVMMITMVLIVYGTYRPGPIEKTDPGRDFCEFFLAPAEPGL